MTSRQIMFHVAFWPNLSVGSVLKTMHMSHRASSVQEYAIALSSLASGKICSCFTKLNGAIENVWNTEGFYIYVICND